MGPTWQVTFDCAEPDRSARFWAAVLGYEVEGPPAGYASWEEFLGAQGVPADEWDSGASIIDPAGERPRIFFQRVPEPKRAKNRLHLDIDVGRERVGAEADRLRALGATKVGTVEEYDGYWVVMRDPEGNEFCLR